MYIVSACLAGEPCRYDGKANTQEKIKQLVEEGRAVKVCPEVLGGLSTPRTPCEQQKKPDGTICVRSAAGEDVTEAFIRGAEKTVEIAKSIGAKKAIMKAKSPSCGCGKIYDGCFNKTLIKGDGLATKLLKENDIRVYTEEDFQN